MIKQVLGFALAFIGVLSGGLAIYALWKGIWIAITLLPAGFLIALAGVSLIRGESLKETGKDLIDSLTW